MWAEQEMAACLHVVWRDLIFLMAAEKQSGTCLWYFSFSMVSAAGSSRNLGREEGEEENGSCSALLLSQGQQE